MPGADHADEALVEELLPEHRAGLEVGEHADADVDLALGELALDVVAAERTHQEVGAGGLGAEAGQQRRDHHQRAEIDAGDREGTAGRAGLEGLWLGEGAVDLAERAADGSDQLLGAGRREHASRRAHQQRVAEELAEAAQGMAHRRLGEADPRRGAGDAALDDERLEDDQRLRSVAERRGGDIA